MVGGSEVSPISHPRVKWALLAVAVGLGLAGAIAALCLRPVDVSGRDGAQYAGWPALVAAVWFGIAALLVRLVLRGQRSRVAQLIAGLCSAGALLLAALGWWLNIYPLRDLSTSSGWVESDAASLRVSTGVDDSGEAILVIESSKWQMGDLRIVADEHVIPVGTECTAVSLRWTASMTAEIGCRKGLNFSATVMPDGATSVSRQR